MQPSHCMFYVPLPLRTKPVISKCSNLRFKTVERSKYLGLQSVCFIDFSTWNSLALIIGKAVPMWNCWCWLYVDNGFVVYFDSQIQLTIALSYFNKYIFAQVSYFTWKSNEYNSKSSNNWFMDHPKINTFSWLLLR